MTDYKPRLFASDAEIAHLGEGLIARTLAKEEWTHEAHLGGTTYLLLKRPDIDLDSELPGLIRRFNAAAGLICVYITRGDREAIELLLPHARREPAHVSPSLGRGDGRVGRPGREPGAAAAPGGVPFHLAVLPEILP